LDQNDGWIVTPIGVQWRALGEKIQIRQYNVMSDQFITRTYDGLDDLIQSPIGFNEAFMRSVRLHLQ
jgi:hypothetical protein